MNFNLQLDKQYAIMLSGGLDSATLLGLILKQYPTIQIQPFTIPKHDGSSLYVNNIIAHLNNKFNANLPKTIHVGNPDVHHSQQSTTAVTDIFSNYLIDFLFNGLNRNPPELNDLLGAPKRATKSPTPKVILPFVDMLKTDILKLMYDNNLEELINITHSCTEQQIGRCNKCWQCTERAWAFKQLNKEDTGTL